MDLVSLLASDSYIIYNKEFASKYGVEEAILLGAMCSYQKSFNNEEFFREEEKISEDTGLTVYAIRKAKQTLKNLGILEISKKGLPSRHYFKVIPEKVLNPIYSGNDFCTTTGKGIPTTTGNDFCTTVGNENITTTNNDSITTNYNNNYNKKDNITTINSSYTETVNHRSDDTIISSKNSSPKSLNNFSENIIENANLTKANSDLLKTKKDKNTQNRLNKEKSISVIYKNKIAKLFNENIAKSLYKWIDVLVENKKLMTSTQFDMSMSKLKELQKQYKESEIIDCINNAAMAGYNNFNYTAPKTQNNKYAKPNRTYDIPAPKPEDGYGAPDLIAEYQKPGMSRREAWEVYVKEREEEAKETGELLWV